MNKKSFATLAVFGILTNLGSYSAQASARADKDMSDRLSVDLNMISQSARTGRLWGSGILLTAGVGLTTAAIVTGLSDEYESSYPITYGTAGGIFVGLGIAGLVFPMDREKIGERYDRLPSGTNQELRSKVIQGEGVYSFEAESDRSRRQTGAVIGWVIGAGSLAAYLAASNKAEYSFFAYSAVVFTGLGFFDFFHTTLTEDKWEEYKKWKEGLVASTNSQSVQLSMAPTFIPSANPKSALVPGLALSLSF